MRAVVYDRYGGPEVLELRLVPRPVAGRGEVLVRVKAAALNPKDSFVRKGRFRLATGRRFPKLLGYDFAGVVEALGPGVSGLAPGDEVFGMVNGMAGATAAEYAVVKQGELSAKPGELSFEEAAALPLAALTALQALRDVARVQPGAAVLVNGASGGVGVHAVQLAKAFGARVTTVSSARNLELCRSLGADEALDYAVDSPLARRGAWDVVFDVFGNWSFGLARPALTARGVYVSTVPSLRIAAQQLFLTRLGWPRARLVLVRSNAADLAVLRTFVEAGRLRPVVDRVFPLAEAGAAQAWVETKRARGKVVLRVD